MDSAKVIIPEFPSVLKRRFFILYIGTLGLYAPWWFYRNWKILKNSGMPEIWPIPRAIFLIFFTHELFGIISRREETAGLPRTFDPSPLAWWFIGILIITNVLGNFDMYLPTIVNLALFALVLIAPPMILWKVQSAINATNEKNGTQHVLKTSYSAAEILAIIVGGMAITLSFIGYTVPDDQLETAPTQTQEEVRPQRPL